MAKLDHLKTVIEELQQSEGEGFVLNQMNLSEEIMKYEKENVSLFIKVITILGGLLGSTFLVASISILFRLNSKPTLILGFAIFLIVISVLASRFNKTLIFDTSFVSILLWGSFLVSISLSQLKVDEQFICVSYLLIGVFTIVASKNSYQSLIALLMIAGSLFWLIHVSKYVWLFHGYIIVVVIALVQIFQNEAMIITSKSVLKKIYAPLKIGLIIILLFSLGVMSDKSVMHFDVKYPWISSIVLLVAVILFSRSLMNKLDIVENNNKALVYLIGLIVLGLTSVSPGIVGSILVLLLCFYVNYKTGYVIGGLSLIYFIIMFYYELDYSLLIKSELLLAAGALFGGIYFLSARKMVTDEKN